MGYPEVIIEVGRPLIGYDGTPRKDGSGKVMWADITVHRNHIKGAANDLGFMLVDGQYSAVISDYDRSHHNNTWLAKLTQNYANHKLQKEAKKHGWNVKQVQKGDTIQLELVQYR